MSLLLMEVGLAELGPGGGEGRGGEDGRGCVNTYIDRYLDEYIKRAFLFGKHVFRKLGMGGGCSSSIFLGLRGRRRGGKGGEGGNT